MIAGIACVLSGYHKPFGVHLPGSIDSQQVHPVRKHAKVHPKVSFMVDLSSLLLEDHLAGNVCNASPWLGSR
jgi:hypothetical protein